MEEMPYSNSDILNLFYIHGECEKILERTCRTFNNRYPDLPRMTRRKFRIIESNFLQHGTVVSRKRFQNYVTRNEENETNVLAYFTAFPNSSTRAASLDLGKIALFLSI